MTSEELTEVIQNSAIDHWLGLMCHDDGVGCGTIPVHISGELENDAIYTLADSVNSAGMRIENGLICIARAISEKESEK